MRQASPGIRMLTAVLALATASWGEMARGQEAGVRVHRDDDRILVDWTLRGFLDRDLEASLRSGLPARLSLGVELWEDRASFWDRQVLGQEFEHRILFDLLDQRFEVIDLDGDRLGSRRDLREIEELLGSERGYPVCPMDEVDPEGRFYVVVEVVIEPLSVEEVRDLERWLRGSLTGGGEGDGLSGISRHLLGVLKSQVGLGRKQTVVRTPGFHPGELPRQQAGSASDAPSESGAAEGG